MQKSKIQTIIKGFLYLEILRPRLSFRLLQFHYNQSILTVKILNTIFIQLIYSEMGNIVAIFIER